MLGYTDSSDHATCEDTRRSVSGGAVILSMYIFRERSISWCSRMQRVVISVTTESEYMALSEIDNELKFLLQVQQFVTPSTTKYQGSTW